MKKIDNFSKVLILFIFIVTILVYFAIKYQTEIKAMRYDTFKKFETVSLVNKKKEIKNVSLLVPYKEKLNIKEIKSLKDLNKNNLEKKYKVILIGSDFKDNGHFQLKNHLKNEERNNHIHIN